VRDPGSIPGSGRSPGEGSGNPLQYSAWKILRTEGPGGLQSMGLQRIGHDRATDTFTLSILERTFLTNVHNRHYLGHSLYSLSQNNIFKRIKEFIIKNNIYVVGS